MAFPPRAQKYLLLHDSRHGLELYTFSSTQLLAEGLTVYEDLQDWQRKLLRFLQVTVEFNDYIIIRKEPLNAGLYEHS